MESPHKSRSGLGRILNAFRYSIDGLRSAFQHESAFRQELALAVILGLVATGLPIGLTQKAILVLCIMLVLIVELINSAVEATVDRISLDEHPLAKRAKDICSAAVFLSLANCLLVWTLVVVDAFG
jgi:diacylglycerol kinase (ATP)